MFAKKLFPLISAALLAAANLSFPAFAEESSDQKLPFELSAPENVSITYLDGNDSENTCEIHYSQNTSMSEWSSRRDSDNEAVMKELNDMGYDDLWITSQIDWSIDSQDDWHYNEYWDSEGYDADYHMKLGEWAFFSCAYSPETSMSEWIFRYMGNIDDKEDTRWYGRHEDGDDYDGWKDVLKPEQYDIVKHDEESVAKIDLAKHTIYTRVRFLVTARTLGDESKDIRIGSEWSETAAVGKDAEEVKPLEPGDIAAPVISDLKYTDEDFNGYPVISFKLDVSDELSAQLSQATGTKGAIWLIAEAKLADKENWVELQGDFTIKSGDMKIDLNALADSEGKIEKDTPIELRAKYLCMQEGLDDFESEYSSVLTFGATDMQVDEPSSVIEESTADEESKAETTTTAKAPKASEKEEESSFPWWIIILIIILILIIIIIIIILKKKKDMEN